MPDAAVDFERWWFAGPGAYPTTPAITRVLRESRSWADTEVQFDRPEYRQAWLRAAAKRPRQIDLLYEGRPRASLDTLIAFYEAANGTQGTFPFTHPVTSETLVMRFVKPTQDWQHRRSGNLYTFVVPLEEVRL